MLAPELTVGALFDRMLIAPWGLAGGLEGGKTSISIRRAGDDRFRLFTEVFGTVSPSKFSNVVVRRGDLIRLVSSGGGGFGDPAERPREDVLRDVRDRYVSPAAAAELYGVELEAVAP